jgi:DNA-binding winged helix-turn-helix (wHTH) protein
MNKKTLYLFIGLLLLIVSVWLFLTPKEQNDDFSQDVKIALRDVGHQLLLNNSDSTSLVLPIVEFEPSTYRLSFQKDVSIHPDSLVTVIQKSFETSEMPKHYRVEVIKCADKEVAYSYLVKKQESSSIIPCGGRILPYSCYTITVYFLKKNAASSNTQIVAFALLLASFVLFALYFFKKERSITTSNENNEHFTSIGSFKFYHEQNKLVKEATEINLSKKECELLSIFIERPNQIISREELTKKVWEDNGVFVGRSLDTYISKLRKKLITDDSIKLINVHGVGYKLEIG